MRKKLGFSLMMLTLCTSVFVGGCSCSNAPTEPTNPNAKVILANEIALDKNLVTNAQIGVPISITYTIRPSDTTDKTIIVQSSDETVATVDKSEVTDTLSDTIVVTPVSVGTVNIVFTWTGFFDNDVEQEERTLKKAATIHVVGEYGKETMSVPTGLNYSNGKFTWNKVGYGTDGVTDEPNYELTITGGAAPTTPITLSTNEYEFALTAGVTYTAKVKAKPTNDLQYFYTASAYSEEIELYKLSAVDSYTVNNGVVTWDKVDGATKYIVNINGEDVETIDAPELDETRSFDTKSYFSSDVTQVVLKVKAINDTDALIFNGEYSANTVTINQIGKTSNFALTKQTTSTVLSWDSVEYATSYVLKITKVGEAEPIVNETLTSTSYMLNDSFNGSYNVQVKALGNEYTLAGEFTDSYQFTTLNINTLTATLENGVVTYSATSLNGNKIVFSIINDSETVTVEKTEDGSFEIAEYIDTNTYIVTAQLVPADGSNFVVSASKTIGYHYEIGLTNGEDYKTNLVWDRISNASSYTLEITEDSSGIPTNYENIANVASGKVKFELPETIASGVHKARIKVVSSDNLVDSYGEYFTFVKLDASDISTTYTNNVLKVSTTNANIKTIVVYVNEINEKFELESDEEIDFATLGLTTGTYTISVQALAESTGSYANSSVITTSHRANVIKNPEIASISADGKLVWDTNTNYGTFKIYVDKGESNEQVLDATTNEITLGGLTEGEHEVYVVVNPINGYLASVEYFTFTFKKLGLVNGLTVVNNQVVWESVDGADSYLLIENDKAGVVVDGTSYTPTEIKASNEYKVTPIGNGRNSVTGGEKEAIFTKIAKVDNLSVVDGKLTFTAIDNIDYKVIINDEEMTSGVNYLFTGVTPYEIQEVYVYGTRTGFFDADPSDVLKVKKLGQVVNISVSSTDKTTYTITWDEVDGANTYIVNYNGSTYYSETNELTVLGEIAANEYQVSIYANYIGDELITDATGTYGYIISDVSDTYAFTKLSAPTAIQVKDGKLVWENENTVSVTNYEMQYTDNDGESWVTKTLDDTLTNDMTFLSSGSYKVKLRAVGTDANVISSDYSPEVVVTRINTVSNLKVKNGAIVWDSYTSDASVYVYDVYVYTKVGGADVLFGEPILNYPRTTFEIPNIAVDTEYFIEVMVKNAAGNEIPSEISSQLKVVKLSAPSNVTVSNSYLTWDEVKYNGTVATTSYRWKSFNTNDESELYYDVAGNQHIQLHGQFEGRISYNISVMAYGTEDSEDTMFGYLNSDYSVEREVYKLEIISNPRIVDGALVWEHTYTADDKYLPVGYYIVFTSFIGDEDGDVTTHEYEEILPNTATTYDLEDIVPGDYKIEIYTLGNGVVSLNSGKFVLGDSEKIRKLATPTGLRMQDGIFVWDEHTTDMSVTYVFYNNGVEFFRQTADNKTYNPDVEVTEVFNITMQTVAEGAIYSNISEQITIYKLPKIQTFKIEDGMFKWTKVENATGYTIVLSYMEEVTDDGTTDPDMGGDVAPIDETVDGSEGEPDDGTTEEPGVSGPQLVEKIEEIVVPGGNTTEIYIPEYLPQQYTVKQVYANGNTTADHTTIGYFNSVAINSDVNFTPLDTVKNLTVNKGTFVWDMVTGADYYALQILDGTERVVKKVAVTSNSYDLTDDALVPAGTYTLKVTPISKSDTYLTTYISTDISFSKRAELTNIRIEDGYIAWNVSKNDILEAYKSTLGEEGGEGGEGGELPPEEIMPMAEGDEGGDEGGEEVVYNSDIFRMFYSVAVGSYMDNANTAAFYSLAYTNIKLINTANNKTVTKTIQPFDVIDASVDDTFVTCYYFVDLEVDTWKISIGAAGNTVNPADEKSIKYVDGVKPTTFITASKLSKPVSPIHYDATAILDGKLIYTPVRKLDGTLYEKYIIEAVPASLPDDKVIKQVITASGETSQEYDLTTLGLKDDIPYNISIKTYGDGDYLNSDTPMTTMLTMLGKPILSVSGGNITWGATQAKYYELVISDEFGEVIETVQLQNTETKYVLDENYPVGKYIITVQAMGDGINKISSLVSDKLIVTKQGTIQDETSDDAIVLNQGAFEWDNVNPDNGYSVLITAERDGANGKVTETYEYEVTNVTGPKVYYEIPSSLASYVIENETQYYFKYSISVKLLGTADGANLEEDTELFVSGEFSAPSRAYQKLNTPTNVRVEDGVVMWNDVAGASAYQVFINGEIVAYEPVDPVEMALNIGTQITYELPTTFKTGVYRIKVRAIGSTQSLANPNTGYLTGSYTNEVAVVRTAQPVVRTERGELMWTSMEELPYEATAKVRLDISGQEIIIEGIENNAGFDFDNPDYPAGNYSISVQFLGNNELITAVPEFGLPPATIDDQIVDPGANYSEIEFYYISSEIRTKTFTKLAEPSIKLAKYELVIDEENEITEDKNAVKWTHISGASGYDVYIVTEEERVVTEDNPETEDIDETVTQIIRNVEVYKFDDENYAHLFVSDGTDRYFLLSDVTYENYFVYVRAVGNDSSNISSTRSNELSVHIPVAPTNFKYVDETGTIEWTNVTVNSDIVLAVKKYNETTYEYEEVSVGVLPAGTTLYKLSEIGDYQVRIKARLTIEGGNVDSDFNETTLNISFRLFNSGNGSPTSPYTITKEDELNNIRYYLDRHFVIMNSITLNAYANWQMIGSLTQPFTGTIKGNGNTISGIRYQNEINTDIAFIHAIGDNRYFNTGSDRVVASVTGLKLDVTVDADGYRTRTANYAGIAIVNKGDISNCTISGNVKVNGNALSTTLYGGVVVENYGTITSVINKTNITAVRNTNSANYATRVGGISARNYGVITNSGNEGLLYGQDVGGITCYNYNEINNSYNKGPITIISSGYTEFNLKLGGIAAYNTNSTYSYYKQNKDGEQQTNSLVNVPVTGKIDTCYVIMGTSIEDGFDNTLTISNSSGKSAYIGGIVGNNTVQSSCITNCYAMIGSYTSSGSDAVATLAGNISSYSVSNYYQVFSNCYSYSTSTTLVAQGHGNQLKTLNANHSGYIIKVTSIDAGTVSITGIIISEETNYLPKFSWQ